ncbi:MAG: phage virion morphogenesis protein [Paracoccaceae bacterium]|nr:phage virion morphogenesis protein [Paracoccaceae bacterium]
MFRVDLKEDEITAGLDRLSAGLSDLSPVMQDLGEFLMTSTKARFPDGKAPDGTPWAAKSPATKGRDRRPLFGPSGILSSQIFSNPGADSVEVGSNRVYAAMMQFGGTKERWPHLWGDIPARPFLGISDSDRRGILAIFDEYLTDLVQAGVGPGR